MAKQNVPLLSFNRGLISPKALARIDLDRTRLSAEVFRNWIAKTQGAMTIRPGTKHFGSSLNDTGAAWIEFVAATDDVAMLEVTDGTMRVWLGDDPHAIALLERPFIDTTLSLSDTGWADTSTGGTSSVSVTDSIPTMTAATTNGVTMSASSAQASFPAWNAGDDSTSSEWRTPSSSLPAWLKVDFGSGNTKAIVGYSIRASSVSNGVNNAPANWTLEGSNNDVSWTVEDTRTGQTGWSLSEKRSFTAQNDTGATAYRYWRWNISAINGDSNALVDIAEVELFTPVVNSKSDFSSGQLTLNATAIGALARVERHVVVDTGDLGVEHSLAVNMTRGPVTFRVGSTARDDDYISETMLGTGHHNLAFTPSSDFYVTLQSDAIVDRIIASLDIGDTGTVEITAPWTADDLDNIRFDQSADVVYADCEGVHPAKIERRGTGRSWSVVEYEPNNGPFLASPTTAAKLSVSHFFGNTTLNSDVPFFRSGHVGALVRIFHEKQSGQWKLGALDAKTDAIAVTGISDTGTTPTIDGTSDREITIAGSGAWTGTAVIERSVDGADVGFKQVPSYVLSSANANDTGTFSQTFIDKDDNIKAWYRVRIKAYTSGVAVITMTYKGGGGITGHGRITGYNSNTDVDFEVLSRFSDTGPSDNWQEGYWSDARGFPSAVALHSSRLAHANGGNLFLSVSDDYENFDDTTIGDAAPIIRTLGSGPVDNIYFLLSLIRLVIGTTGAELTLRSSSLDEPVTPTNSAARSFATNGSANIRALKLDSRGIHVQRSRQHISMVGFGSTSQTLGDYEGTELTLLVPDLLKAGVVSIAVQRKPDTRLHCVLADGTVGILTYEPSEEVICWQTWTTQGAVEKAMVLPGLAEDAVYYHIRRVVGSGNDVYTKVLLSFDGTDASTTITDRNEGGSAHVWTANGDAQIDTAQAKFGGASLLCDGTGDYVTTPDHADFALGSGDWTVDFWFRCNVASGATARICGQNDSSLSGASSSFGITRHSSNTIQAYAFFDGTSSAFILGTTQFTDSVNTGWHHLALIRSGNVLTLYLDGVAEGTAAITGTVNNSSNALSIGRAGEFTAQTWNGWIDEFRLSVGIARWTANFTPPPAAYGTARRFFEKWAKETECLGDTGLSWLADCASSYTDTGRTNTLADIAPHLPNTHVILWGDLDTGGTPFIDLSPDTDTGGAQKTYLVDTGGDVALSLTNGVHHVVAGLPYTAAWKSTKMAYAAQLGTALTMKKRVPQLGLVLYKAHNRGLFTGYDTGSEAVQPLPRMIDKGAAVDPDKIFATLDQAPFATPGPWDEDSRVTLRAKAPRPMTVLAAVPAVDTNES